MSDELTRPLIEDKKVSFDPYVRGSFVNSDRKEQDISLLDDGKTTAMSKNKTDYIGKTYHGFSKSAEPVDPEEYKKIKAAHKELKKKDEYRAKYGDEAFKIEYGEDEFTRIYGSECDGDKPCCGDKCTIVGGKKTKRRRYTRKYTKKYRSRKSRRSKKGSKNNKK